MAIASILYFSGASTVECSRTPSSVLGSGEYTVEALFFPDRAYEARDGLDESSDVVLVLQSRDLARKFRKRGRRVARDAAVIPIPGSTVDQIATSVAANRKSFCTKPPINLSRIILAMEPLTPRISSLLLM